MKAKDHRVLSVIMQAAERRMSLSFRHLVPLLIICGNGVWWNALSQRSLQSADER